MREKGQNCGISLSKRLQMLAEMVTPGNRVADVGCDHGFLAIYLVSRGICPGAIAMDVREGPLAGAREHIRECGLGDYIETRLSDGLVEYIAGEADTLVCAGMGGRLMERILTEAEEKAGQMRELILQPQSELPGFRAFLRKAGFLITGENAVFEDGKYYFAMRAVPGGIQGAHSGRAVRTGEDGLGCADAGLGDMSDAGEREWRLGDLFGGLLLAQRHPVLFRYLRQRENYIRQLEASLLSADSEKAKSRLKEVHGELEQIKEAMSYFTQTDSLFR